MPEDWGFAIEPISFEFWQGREGRLHDRIVYTRGYEWTTSRLQLHRDIKKPSVRAFYLISLGY